MPSFSVGLLEILEKKKKQIFCNLFQKTFGLLKDFDNEIVFYLYVHSKNTYNPKEAAKSS